MKEENEVLMDCRIFTIPFSFKTERFDDEGLVSFLSDKKLVEVRDHFFVHNGTPFLAVVVLYNGFPPSSREDPLEEQGRGEGKKDYRELLSEEDWALFKRLREWRNETAKAEGVPPYVLFTNRQLALVATKRPENLTQLGDMEGIGRAKVEKMGCEVIRIIQVFEKGPEKSDDESCAR